MRGRGACCEPSAPAERGRARADCPSGNTAQRLASGGSVLSSDLYDAFGQGQTTAGTPDAFGYGGQWGYYTDGETGLVLCTHRYYDPASGRWLTRDPIGYDGGVNLYAYCKNDPVNDSDAEGTDGTATLPRPGAPPSSMPRLPSPGGGWGPVLSGIGRFLGSGAGSAAMGGGLLLGCAKAAGRGSDLSKPVYDPDHCRKAIKLLEQADRLAQKNGKKLPPKRLEELRQKINAGTITSYDLPGSIQSEFPGEFAGYTLNEIKAMCGMR